MADKQVTVAVPEERVPEFYVWFASFLAAEPGTAPAGGPGGAGPWAGPGAGPWGGPGPWRGRRGHFTRHGFGGDPRPWSADHADEAAWLYRKLAPPARALFDLLIDAPGKRLSGNEVAARLGLDKGAHGVAGLLAWPGRYSRALGRELPIATEGRADGGTDYYMDPEIAAIFAAARQAFRRPDDEPGGEEAP